MPEIFIREFPSQAELRGVYRDHPIDAALYAEAKRLFEIRPRDGNSADYHVRQCLQLAICQRVLPETFTVLKGKKHEAQQSR